MSASEKEQDSIETPSDVDVNILEHAMENTTRLEDTVAKDTESRLTETPQAESRVAESEEVPLDVSPPQDDDDTDSIPRDGVGPDVTSPIIAGRRAPTGTPANFTKTPSPQRKRSENLDKPIDPDLLHSRDAANETMFPHLNPTRAALSSLHSGEFFHSSDRNWAAPKVRIPHRMMRHFPIQSARRGHHGRPVRPATHSRYYEAPNRKDKVITWDEATNARPPLRVDMEGPTPCSYTPITRPPSETNSPAYSFGRRTFVEKDGGARTSWEKTWFQSADVWRQKTDFFHDRRWPAPHQYQQKNISSLGPQQCMGQGFPAYSMGIRREVSINKKGSEKEPSPCQYDPTQADMRQAPAFTHQLRTGGTLLWPVPAHLPTPGPGAYNPDLKPVKKHSPRFTIRGIRREKSHEFGPFASV